MKQWSAAKPARVAFAALAVPLGLYLVGFTWLLVPALLVVLVYYLPFPKLCSSYLSRLILSSLGLMSFLLLATIFQFYLFRHTGFDALAFLVTAPVTAMVWLLRDRPFARPTTWLDKKDIAAMAVVLLFAVPAIMVTGFAQRDVIGIARFGSTQSPDGGNHFMILHDMSKKQHLDYRDRTYYPKGFHLGLAFVQDSVHLNQTKHRFGVNARIFVAEYIVFGSLLAFVFAYFCQQVALLLGARFGKTSGFLLPLAAGLPCAALFLWPFVYEGFLNYLYVVAVFLAGLMYLASPPEISGKMVHRLRSEQWAALCFLALAFGAGMSWPLLVPPLMVIALVYLLPEGMRPGMVPRLVFRTLRREYWPLLAAFALQLAPVYMQMRYAILSTGEQFNALGSIRTFHFGMMLLGFGVVLYASLGRGLPERTKWLIRVVLQPMYLFLGCLMAVQYFGAGELRYYTIKTSLLIEFVVLAILAVVILQAYGQRAGRGLIEQWCMPVISVLLAVLLVVGMDANPLKDMRELFRDASGFGTPAFFEPDVRALVNTASSGKVGDSNITVVHYDPLSDKLQGNMMPANWVTVMQPEPSPDVREQICNAELYNIATYREFNATQQLDFTHKLRECIRMAQEDGRPYYIVTDNGSVKYLRQVVGRYPSLVH